MPHDADEMPTIHHPGRMLEAWRVQWNREHPEPPEPTNEYLQLMSNSWLSFRAGWLACRRDMRRKAGA